MVVEPREGHRLGEQAGVGDAVRALVELVDPGQGLPAAVLATRHVDVPVEHEGGCAVQRHGQGAHDADRMGGGVDLLDGARHRDRAARTARLAAEGEDGFAQRRHRRVAHRHLEGGGGGEMGRRRWWRAPRAHRRCRRSRREVVGSAHRHRRQVRAWRGRAPATLPLVRGAAEGLHGGEGGGGAPPEHERRPADLRRRRIVDHVGQGPRRRHGAGSRVEPGRGAERRGGGGEAAEDAEPAPDRDHALPRERSRQLPGFDPGLERRRPGARRAPAEVVEVAWWRRRGGGGVRRARPAPGSRHRGRHRQWRPAADRPTTRTGAPLALPLPRTVSEPTALIEASTPAGPGSPSSHRGRRRREPWSPAPRPQSGST